MNEETTKTDIPYRTKKTKVEIYNDHFENAKRYGIQHAQLIIADIPYNLGNNAYASNPQWYIDGDNSNGESKLAGKAFFDTDKDFKINNFFDFCTRYLKKEPKRGGGEMKKQRCPCYDSILCFGANPLCNRTMKKTLTKKILSFGIH